MATNFTRREVQSSVNAIVGLPLWAIGRAADLVWFQFGERRAVKNWNGAEKMVGEYALHVQCSWRISRAETIVTGRGDIFCTPEETKEPTPTDFDWEKGNRFDKIVQSSLTGESFHPSVQGVELGEAGTLHIILEGAYALEIFPHDSQSGEHWRLFKPYTDGPHLVFSGGGFQAE